MFRDRALWVALLLGLLLRLLPMWMWPQGLCVRDECIYRYLARGISDTGVMGVATKGWLAAPGYPYLLAFCRDFFGSHYAVKWLQIPLSVSSIAVLYGITRRVAPDQPRAAQIAAFLLALHPTIAWYSNTWWIETIYIGLLLPAVLAVLIARSSSRSTVYSGLAGLFVAGCILFRGIATALPPLFVIALLLPDTETWRASVQQRWRAAMSFVLVLTLAVAPYSVFASKRYGGFMISDATLGHVLYLGNNDFPPMTFDYGNGVLSQPLFYDTLLTGRPFCKRRGRPPVQHMRCDVDHALAWIQQNPGEFVARVPLRLAQQLNPNSFLTRHIRWGFFPGLPWQLKELLSLWIVATTAVTLVLGTVGGVRSKRSAFAVLSWGTATITFGAAATMYGMTRFRLPIEPLWIVWAATVLAQPKETLIALRRSPWRLALLVGILPLLLLGMGWFLSTGFPLFYR